MRSTCDQSVVPNGMDDMFMLSSYAAALASNGSGGTHWQPRLPGREARKTTGMRRGSATRKNDGHQAPRQRKRDKGKQPAVIAIAEHPNGAEDDRGAIDKGGCGDIGLIVLI